MSHEFTELDCLALLLQFPFRSRPDLADGQQRLRFSSHWPLKRPYINEGRNACENK